MNVTEDLNFYQGHNPHALLREYGSPLYVYNERIFRERCREVMGMCPYSRFHVNYSIKANTNLTLLAIAKQEGLRGEATSPGEIEALLAVGYKPGEIFYITNNASTEDMLYSVEKGILFSADSVSQLDRYGRANPGGRVAVRFNPGVGSGHHDNVVTGGKKTKFGVNEEYIPQVKEVLAKHKLTIVGINQHIGSHILDVNIYMDSVKRMLAMAKNFDTLEFIDLGGGFGIPYHKQDGEGSLDMPALGGALAAFMTEFSEGYGRELDCMIEPGRFIPAESGVLLGTVHAVKNNAEDKYVGTDLGFTVLLRPTLYDSHHDIEVYREGAVPGGSEKVHVVGNVCESGDYIARNRELPVIEEGDALGVLDAGAYGYSMASTYNHRLRPAEVLIRESGELVLIRRRDTYADLLRNMPHVLDS